MMKALNRISIIIPVLNEEDHIGEILKVLDERKSTHCVQEIIIVDGESEDATKEKVFQSTIDIPIQFLTSKRGRPVQMNHGAAHSQGTLLYFLHADTQPPHGYDQAILDAVETDDAGCFRMEFDSKHPLLRTLQWFTRFNWKICRGGDQSLFIKKKCFTALGGYDERYMIYEDGEFIHRIYQNYSFVVLSKAVLTSARKYRQKGTARLQFHFSILHIKNWLGASPNELIRYYKKHIAL